MKKALSLVLTVLLFALALVFIPLQGSIQLFANDNAEHYNFEYNKVLHIEQNLPSESFLVGTLSRDITETQIYPMFFEETTIRYISWHKSMTEFAITASSAISSVEWHMMEDGRLVIDIINAISAFEQSTHNINNSFISTIRTGQQIESGINISRVVFDTLGATIFDISITDDRLHILINFHQNIIYDISHIIYENLANIYIEGAVLPTFSSFFLYNPLRLVIDLPNASLKPKEHNYLIYEALQISELVKNVRYSQFDEHTVRIVADLYSYISYSISIKQNILIISIAPPTFRNIRFLPEENAVRFDIPFGLYLDNISRVELYLQHEYNFILNSDFSDFFGYGDLSIRRGGVDYLSIITEYGVTRFKFNASQILAYVLTYTDNAAYIRFVHPREVHPFIVFIDPGHGGLDPGAVHFGMRESDIVLEVSQMVLDILHNDGIVRAFASRHDDSTVSNAQRARVANDIADIFVSIHFNAANGIATGSEVLYAIPQREVEMGWSLNSRQLAELFQQNLVDALGTNDRGARNRPGILVLNSTTIPAVLLEVEFMDVPTASERIATYEFRRLTAETIVQSIYETFEIFTPPR